MTRPEEFTVHFTVYQGKELHSRHSCRNEKEKQDVIAAIKRCVENPDGITVQDEEQSE